MDALFNGSSYDATGRPESVQNMVARYEDIRVHFPEELTTNSLPFFVDWLIENVYLVEITAFSDEDAYTIFETMNDRGLSLSPSDMLKGYLLANITDEAEKTRANKLWKERLQTLTEVGKETDADSFKAWLRSQYADTIRERKKGASAGDYDRIGTEYHRWVRERRERLGLGGSADYARFINWDFDFYSRQYLRLLEASRRLVPGLEPIFYNAQLGFTLQHPVLLASLVPGDDDETIRLKLQLTSTFIDIVLNRRIWNYRSISYSTMQYNMFLVIRDIRRARPSDLATKLSERLEVDGETFASNSRFALHQQNRKYVHSILARITDYIEQASGMSPRYLEYIGGEGAQRYEVEHIWANKPERHAQDFPHPIDFGDYRNRIGGLLLLPKSFNASYGALEYHQKLPHYLTQNLLARSLHPQSYEHNPGFTRFVEASGLNFGPHNVFNKEDLDARGKLYCSLAERVWNPQRIHRAVLALGTR